MEIIGPICTEVVGLGELPSVLSLAWSVIVLPTTCKFRTVSHLKGESHVCCPNFVVSEVMALKLRRPGSGHELLYPQIFAGLVYLIASIIIWSYGEFADDQLSSSILQVREPLKENLTSPSDDYRSKWIYFRLQRRRELAL